ncbi:prolipoprotein diacylglyceryl transferase [Seonamhaeicola aphaedonensis]|uniref:Prolipoprotein diacylglyceryltransferase n=1 Tax=Seonamhaeicola aphaedonensis TaxID=1461338 RepID=A0A3D9HJ56_9FLAO|nr:prolipoprotein diacylglyceryl transferase family protein [Seonamhaeicola aphaedonensis]RED49465.1 prolipoprotein diacylglyceryltransferase [Seonamhaeicola aphaedonensis]
MTLSLSTPQFFYQLFYALAFVFMFCVVIYKSIKKGHHLRSVLLMFATLTLFIIIGTRLFTIPLFEWYDAMSSPYSEFNNRSSIGGILFGLVGLLIIQRVFKFGKSMFDLFAWVAPIALGITKLGCLLNGCCYGLASNAIWSIKYPAGTNAHHNHWLTENIGQDALYSLSVHPVQLYESLTLFTIGYIVWKTKNRWKGSLSTILLTMILYFSLRFGIEFFRDHSVSQFGTLHFYGVWVYQWAMLALVFVLGLLLWFLEGKVNTKKIKTIQEAPYIHSEFIYIIILSILIYSFQNVLSPFEFNVIWTIFITAVLFSGYYLFTTKELNGYNKLIFVTLLTPFYVLGQSMQENTLGVKSYNRIDVGASFGNFNNEVAFDPQEVQNECGTSTSYSYEYFKQVYQIGGVGYSHVVTKKNHTNTFGANISGGTIKSTNLSTGDSESEFIFGVNPYMKWDSKWFGAGFGFQIGKLRLNKDDRLDVTNIEDAQKNHIILPEFHARIGPRKYLDIDYNYGFMMPSAFPTLYSRSSIGSSFGLSEDYSFRYGHIWNLETDYVSAEALLSDNLGVNVMYVFKENNFDFQEESSGKFMFSLNYRFGYKQK